MAFVFINCAKKKKTLMRPRKPITDYSWRLLLNGITVSDVIFCVAIKTWMIFLGTEETNNFGASYLIPARKFKFKWFWAFLVSFCFSKCNWMPWSVGRFTFNKYMITNGSSAFFSLQRGLQRMQLFHHVLHTQNIGPALVYSWSQWSGSPPSHN